MEEEVGASLDVPGIGGGGGVSAEEDLLSEVLAQLDIERTRRAEVELQYRQLHESTQQRQQQNRQHEKNEILFLRKELEKLQLHQKETSASSNAAIMDIKQLKVEALKEAEENVRCDMIRIKTERDGFKELVEALTDDNSAITQAAAPASSAEPVKPLELYVTRMLECMPWDARVKAHIMATDEFYEWQIYDTKTHQYSPYMKHFPAYFKSLPNVKPASAPASSSNSMPPATPVAAASVSAPPTTTPGKVLTDANCQHNLDFASVNGVFPLPNAGTWEWIMAWTPALPLHHQHSSSSSSSPQIITDNDGWSYGALPTHLLSKNNNTASSDNDKHCQNTFTNTTSRKFRRRRWIRKRILLSYPSISENTKQYLSLLAQNERLNTNISKLVHSLQKSKMQIATLQDTLSHQSAEYDAQKIAWENELVEKDNYIASMHLQSSINNAANIVQDNAAAVAAVANTVTSGSSDVLKGFSKFKTSVKGFVEKRKQSEDFDAVDDTTDAAPTSIKKTEEMIKQMKGSFSAAMSPSANKLSSNATSNSAANNISWRNIGKNVENSLMAKIRSSVPATKDKMSSTTATPGTATTLTVSNKDSSTHSTAAAATVSTLAEDDIDDVVGDVDDEDDMMNNDNVNFKVVKEEGLNGELSPSTSTPSMIPLRLGPTVEHMQQQEHSRRIRTEHQKMVERSKRGRMSSNSSSSSSV